jgi:hypothetical protein
MSGAIPPLPQYAFMTWFSVKKTAQGQLYLHVTNGVLKISKEWKVALHRTTHFTNIFFGILYTSLVFMFFYCRYEFFVVKLITLYKARNFSFVFQ